MVSWWHGAENEHISMWYWGGNTLFLSDVQEVSHEYDDEQSNADLCLYFAWENDMFAMLVAWVDDVMILGPLGDGGEGKQITWKGI